MLEEHDENILKLAIKERVLDLFCNIEIIMNEPDATSDVARQESKPKEPNSQFLQVEAASSSDENEKSLSDREDNFFLFAQGKKERNVSTAIRKKSTRKKSSDEEETKEIEVEKPQVY